MIIEKFSIRKLFGMYNIDLDLKDLVTIYVGENGLGKTTVLNCLYYVLTSNFEKLKDINFESMQIKFEKTKAFIITYADIIEYTNDGLHYSRYEERRYYKYIEDILSKEEITAMIENVANEQYDSTLLRKNAMRLREVVGMPLRIAERTLHRYCLEKINNKTDGDEQNVIKLIDFIKEHSIRENIIYFTTYRRIERKIFEEDKPHIREYDYEIRERDRNTNELIHFGMDDVLELINNNLENIKNLAINGYNEMTGILLKQYLKDDIKDNQKYKIDNQKLNIALDRIGNKIDNKTKMEIIENNNLNAGNKYLLNLLENLINNYEKQTEYDEKIRNFTSTCNKYLNGKEIIYDEGNVQVTIINKLSGTPISINNLSSGEKQIISIFAKLYLGKEKDAVILIDEPELSLSIKWQSMLIPDIVSTKKCKKIIVVTHSPFIFDNEYENKTKSIKNVFKYGE